MRTLRLLVSALLTLTLVALSSSPLVFAAGSITASGGGKYAVGATFTVTVKASGATFDSLQGKVSVSGPVSIVSFSAGSATWLPGKSPANNNQFVGIVGATSSLTVASIKLKGTSTGSGAVSVSGVRLARSGAEVGTGGGSTSFTITPALTPPGSVTVTSTTHPDTEASYEATTVELSWSSPDNGASGYAAIFDQIADTTPDTIVTTTATTAKYENLTVGTHYFHIRANNKDGWGGVTHFKINIKPTTDSSLATPVITSITTADGFSNDIETGTLTGVVISGTGPVGYSMILTSVPDLALPVDKYPAPVVDSNGNWALNVTDPLKVGFYKLTAQGRLESTVSPISAPVAFEISVAEGGKVRLISADDVTATYQQNQAAKVAAAQSRQRVIIGGLGGLILLSVIIFVTVFHRKLFSSFKNS